MSSRGYTLVEIVVSLLITSVMVGAVFSLALTNKQRTKVSDHRMIAAAAERQLSTQLKGFVTSYWDFSAGDWCTSVMADNCANVTQIAGPGVDNGGAGVAQPGPGSWMWSRTPSPWGGDVSDSCGACYALSYGTHTLTNYLPPWFEAAPYNARAEYFVDQTQTDTSSGGRLAAPQVNVTVNWSEP